MPSVYCTTIAPFRVADIEMTPEECTPADAIGWMVYTEGGPRYFYRTKREACTASEALEAGIVPAGGRRWW